jgi:hypothetical protein
MSHRRIARARAWLKARASAEEVLIIGAYLDGANELARSVAQTTGAAFGWHRMTPAQFAAVLATPIFLGLGAAVLAGVAGSRGSSVTVIVRLTSVAWLKRAILKNDPLQSCGCRSTFFLGAAPTPIRPEPVIQVTIVYKALPKALEAASTSRRRQ